MTGRHAPLPSDRAPYRPYDLSRRKKIARLAAMLCQQLPAGFMITVMAGVRGVTTRRTGRFGPDEPARAAAVLQPDDEAHGAFRELIDDMGVSGAEVVRQALLTLHRQRCHQAASREKTDLQEAG